MSRNRGQGREREGQGRKRERARSAPGTARRTARLAVHRATVACVAVTALVATAGVASAHPISPGGVTAPVPLPAIYAGAGVTVAGTAIWLGIAGDATGPSASRPMARLTPAATRALGTIARVAILTLFAATLAHGVVGRQVPAENLATVVIWPLLLKGTGLVAIVAGSPWRAISPWETLYDALAAVEGEEIALTAYPARLGHWPAVVGFVAGVGVLENLTLVTRDPAVTVAVAAGYAVAMLAGGVAFGRRWFARADALAVLFSLLGRVAVLDVERSDDGSLTVGVRAPWSGAADPLGTTSLAVFVVAALYTVSFDGFTLTRPYQRLLDDARAALGVGTADVALYLAGLLAFVASYLVAAAVVERAGRSARDGERSVGGAVGDSDRAGTGHAGTDRAGVEDDLVTDRGTLATAHAFGGTLVPIAAGYEVAHNYPYVAANLGQAVAVARDLALGTGGGQVSLLGWLPLAGVWASQVALVVAGHLVAVIAAHRVATRRFPTVAAARRGHAPLVVVMVGYTLVSLWIVSRPVVG